ncbi:hypothetical protein SVIOM342S_04851 [Streptomyces violaceorubidus]
MVQHQRQRRLTTLGGDRPHRPPYAPGAAHGHRSARPVRRLPYRRRHRREQRHRRRDGLGSWPPPGTGWASLTARRKDRIEALAEEIEAAGHKATAYPLDVTDREAVDEFATAFKTVGVLVNNAGGALGADPVATGDPDDWRRMYETNVIGTLNLTQALLPKLEASGDGTVVVVSSTAGLSTYEGGAGYVAAKHGEHVLAETLRLEIVGRPVRVIEIAPGMVKTDEFALTRFGGDQDKAAKVYQGVAAPLTADDVADTITWAVTRPAHVNIDLLVVRPRAQASNTKVHREG